MSSDKCSICLEVKNENFSNLEEFDQNNVRWSTKLQNVIPELVWYEYYTICEMCKLQTESAYEFRILCINLENDRKNFTEPLLLDHIAVDYKDFNTEEIDNFSENEAEAKEKLKILTYTCDNCSSVFISKNMLINHIQKEHQHSENLEENIRSKEFQCSKCQKLYTLEKTKIAHEEKCDGIRRHSTNLPLEFKCEKCSKTYSTKKILTAHLKQCALNNESIQCKDCLENVKGKEEFVNHLKNIHNVNTNYFCKICLKNCDSESDFTDHMSKLHQKTVRTRIFSCEICKAEYKTTKLVIAHCVRDHNMVEKDVKPYTCSICSRRFTSSANLIQHKKYHDGNRSHICSFCGKSYITQSDLTYHEYTHFNRRNYKCEICQKAYNTNKNLRSHILVVHTDSTMWKYCCTICQKRFPLKSGYDEHMKRHKGVKPFPCHICNKPFVSRSELKKHMKFHSNVRNVRAFKCEHCSKEYKEQKMYDIHLTKEHGIGNAKIPVRVRKYVCHICPSSFYDKQKLTRHLCTHSGLRPFACTVCDKKYTDKSYLNQHLKHIHKIQTAPKFE